MKTHTMSLGDLKGMEQSLTKLLTTDLEVKLAWKLRKFAATVSHTLTGLETCRLDTAKKFVDPANPSKVAADKVEEFKAEYQKCLDTELTLEIPELQLRDLGNLKLSAMDMDALAFLFPED